MVQGCFLSVVFSPLVVPTQVPLDSQNRVLTYGILGAVVMRAIFIGLGEAAMNVFHPILLGFAGVLIFSSYKLLSEGEDDEEEDLSENKLIAFASSALDATDSYDGANFFSVVNRCSWGQGKEEGVAYCWAPHIVMVCTAVPGLARNQVQCTRS